MNSRILTTAILFICAFNNSISSSIKLQKKSVFDIIPFHNNQNLEEMNQKMKRFKTEMKLRNSLSNLWNQYNGSWMGMNGKISLFKTHFENEKRKPIH